MQCEYRDNASARTTAAESIADARSRDGLDVDFREVDRETWQPLTHWLPYRPGTAARFAPPASTSRELDAYVPPDPMLELDRPTVARLGDLAERRPRDRERGRRRRRRGFPRRDLRRSRAGHAPARLRPQP